MSTRKHGTLGNRGNLGMCDFGDFRDFLEFRVFDLAGTSSGLDRQITRERLKEMRQ